MNLLGVSGIKLCWNSDKVTLIKNSMRGCTKMMSNESVAIFGSYILGQKRLRDENYSLLLQKTKIDFGESDNVF